MAADDNGKAVADFETEFIPQASSSRLLAQPNAPRPPPTTDDVDLSALAPLASAGQRQDRIAMQQADGGSDTKRRRVQQPTATGDQDTAMEGRLAAAGQRQSSIDMTHAAGTAGHDAAAAQMRPVSITGDHSIRQDAEAQPQKTKRKKRGKRRNAHQPSATTLSKYD